MVYKQRISSIVERIGSKLQFGVSCPLRRHDHEFGELLFVVDNNTYRHDDALQ